MKNLDKYYGKFYVFVASLFVFFLFFTFKGIYFGLYGITLSKLSGNEKLVADISYFVFSVVISLYFFVKHKGDSIDDFKKYLKFALIGLATIIVYESTSVLELLVLYLFRVDIKNMSILFKTIYLILFEVGIIGVIVFINRDKLKKNFKDIFKNYNDYYTKYLKLYILTLVVMILSNLLINSLTQSIAGNEEAIRNTFNKAPVYMFFSAVVFAPFAEEMVFRRSLRNIITDGKSFVIASGLIFGGLHVIGNVSSLFDILYIIPYSIPGFAFAYMLLKTDNIFVSMGIHFLHNGLLMTLQVLLLFF